MPNGAARPSWHELFDKLAIERGHRDNLALAQALCDLNGNTSLTAFDTAVKNLRNWRAGLHVPRRRNYLLLCRLLEIDRLDPDQRHAWDEAYRDAHQTRESFRPIGQPVAVGELLGGGVPHPTTAASISQPAELLSAAPAVSGERRSGARKLIFTTGLLSGVLAGLLGGLVIGTVLVPQSISPAFGFAADIADADGGGERVIVLRRGQSMVVDSMSARDCRQTPPAWHVLEPTLPDLSTGQLGDGGPSSHYEPACGRRVGARAVTFSAKRRGEDHILLEGRAIRLNVY